MYDLLIRRVKRVDTKEIVDVAIKDGKIAEIGDIPEEAKAAETIDGTGLLLSPGFVDSHIHLDKSRSLTERESPTLEEAVFNYSDFYKSIPEDKMADSIKARARATLRDAVRGGSTTVRTHVNFEGNRPLLAAEALNDLRKELKDVIDVQITSLPNFFDTGEKYEAHFTSMAEAYKRGLVDYLGGAPHMHEGPVELTERIFKIAVEIGAPIDFHIDEQDNPDISTFIKTAELTKKYGYEGRVSCGHVTALNAVSDEEAAAAIELAKEAELHIITLPSCNMYLMGRTDKQPIRRGITRVREFSDAGVNIAYASDNIRDPFRPIGNGDMLEEGLFCAQVAQMVTKSDLKTIYKMGTYNPARALLLKDYGLDKGSVADLVLIDAEDEAAALVNQATRTHVIKRGKVVARNTRTSEVAF
jgi:cytosine deaminase